MKVYISGKVTGTNDYIERFKAVEERLTGDGHMVFNPVKVNSGMPEGTSYEEYMKVSFRLLELADAVYMMDGWGNSKGAMRELNYAEAMGKKIYFEYSGGIGA